MKPRSREVNIFNMSLLDILSGALGAFCFVMLVLFPSYKNKAAAGTGDAASLQKELERTRAELQQAREGMSKMSKGQRIDVQQTLARLKQTEDAWHQAEARGRQAEAAVRQAQSAAQQNEQKFEKVTRRVQLASAPVVVQASWNFACRRNLYVRALHGQVSGNTFPKSAWKPASLPPRLRVTGSNACGERSGSAGPR